MPHTLWFDTSYGQLRLMLEGYWKKQVRLEESEIRRTRFVALYSGGPYLPKGTTFEKIWPLPSDQQKAESELPGGMFLKLLAKSVNAKQSKSRGT